MAIITPASIISSLNFAMASKMAALGMTPASLSGVALTMTMNFTVLLL